MKFLPAVHSAGIGMSSVDDDGLTIVDANECLFDRRGAIADGIEPIALRTSDAGDTRVRYESGQGFLAMNKQGLVGQVEADVL